MSVYKDPAAAVAGAVSKKAAAKFSFKGTLKALGLTNPWGWALIGASIGVELLIRNIFKPKLEPLPVKTHNLSGGREVARWVLGERRVNLEWVDGTALPGVHYRDNHIRLIAAVSEGACEGVREIWLNQDPFPYNGTSVLVPREGTQYVIPGSEVSKYSFPSRYAFRLYPKFLADGTQAGTALTTGNPRWRIPPGRQYNGNPGENDWGSEPTNATTLFRDQAGGPTTDFGLEVKEIGANYRMDGISWVQEDLFQPFFQQTDPQSRLYKGVPDTDIRMRGLKITWPGQAEATWTSNPIAMLYWVDTVYRGIPESKIDTASFRDDYNACEETLVYGFGASAPPNPLPEAYTWYIRSDNRVYRRVNDAWEEQGSSPGDYAWFAGRGTPSTDPKAGGNVAVRVPRYRCHLEIESGMQIEDIYRQILVSCAGVRYEQKGKIHYRVGDPARAVSLTVAPGDVLDVIEAHPWQPIEARINKFTARMSQSSQNDWLPDTIAYEDTQARARDGALRTTEFTLEAVTDPIQAANITSIMLKQARLSASWVLHLGGFPGMAQSDLAPYDILRVTLPELGLADRKLQVMGARPQPDGTVIAVVQEYADDLYAPVLALPALPRRVLKFPAPHATAFLAAEGVTIHVGVGPPAPELGADGDLYLQRGGNIWYKADGTWIDSGRAAAGAQGFITFEIESTEEVERPLPPQTAPDGTVAYNLATGQYWLRERGGWTYKGDLTGDAGPRGPGVIEWASDRAPRPEDGTDGDMWRRATGEWWIKVQGTWVKQEGVLGKNGARVIAVSGHGPPLPPAQYDPLAEDGDMVFARGSLRFYQLEGGSWIEIADLSPNRTFVYTDIEGAPPSATNLPQIASARQGDEARNGRTGEIWRLSGTVWTQVGDATRAGGFSVGQADPPSMDGVIVGDVYLSKETDKRYVWTQADDGSRSWVHDGYIHASQWIPSTAIPNTGTPGDCYLDPRTGDFWCVGADGTVPDPPDGTLGREIVSTPIIVGEPGDCKVYVFAGYPPSQAFGNVNDGVIDLKGRYGVKENSPTDTGGQWPPAKRLAPEGTEVSINQVADPDDLLQFFVSRRSQKEVYALITGGDDIGEIWHWKNVIARGRRIGQWEQTNVRICGNAAITAGTLAAPTFRRSDVNMLLLTAGSGKGTVTVSFRWTGGVGNGYNVRYRPLGGEWTTERINSITIRNHHFSGLRANTTYEIAIQTVGASSRTTTWVQVTVTTPGILRPSRPVEVNGAESDTDDGHVNVDWEGPTAWGDEQVEAFIVRLRQNAFVRATETVEDAAARTHVFVDVVAGSYQVEVAARNPGGTSDFRRSSTFHVTGETTPTPPPPSVILTPNPPREMIATVRAVRTGWYVDMDWVYTQRPGGAATGFEAFARNISLVGHYNTWRRIGGGNLKAGRLFYLPGFLAPGRLQVRLRATNAAGVSTAASFNPVAPARHPDH